jgi:hypothetical protein
MIKPNAGLSIVNQSAMLVAAGPCVCMIISLSLGGHSLCLVRNVLFLTEGAAELGQCNVL